MNEAPPKIFPSTHIVSRIELHEERTALQRGCTVNHARWELVAFSRASRCRA
jgi:hypothetical protein